MSTTAKPTRSALLARCLRLRCPACGAGRLVESWRSTYPSCSACGHDFRVETGFYLGSIYFNYGVTAAVGLVLFLPIYLSGWLSPIPLTIAGGVFCVAFSVWFFRYARSLWLGFDYYYCLESRGLGHQLQPASVSGDDVVLDPSGSQDDGLLDFVCPFCHRQYAFREPAAGRWVPCPYCQRDVLLAERSRS